MNEISAVNERLERAVKDLEGAARELRESARPDPDGGADSGQLNLEHAAMTKAVADVADRLDAAIARLAAALER